MLFKAPSQDLLYMILVSMHRSNWSCFIHVKI